ncbi:MAG: hypothetical protein QM765_14520 [Myxococcales bacterium]
MANTLLFFLTDEDEVAFFRALEPLDFEVYPEVSPKGYQPFKASAANASKLEEEAYYLAAPQFGELVCREVRKGPHRGMLSSTRCAPRSCTTSARAWTRTASCAPGRSGPSWEIAGDRQKLMTKPDLLRAAFDRVRSYLKKLHHSEPNGYFIGHHAARKFKEGLVLREAGRKGETVVPFK